MVMRRNGSNRWARNNNWQFNKRKFVELGPIRRCYGEANHLKGCAWNIREKGRTPCIKRHSN